jgi:NAD(P)-dependent dehydrogenase (short-subunit alcohol dehydrogenase family)
MQQRFAGKVVIVTGASSGIGKVSALEFAKEGAKVVIAARRREQSEQVVREIHDLGGEAIFVPTDTSKTEDIQAMVARTIETFGRLDCAFNNAGMVGEVFRPTHEHTEESWDAVMNLNLKGVWLCMKYQIPEMLKSGGGAIVNNSSVYGLAGSTVGHAPYSASKHGLIGLTKSAAFDYAKQGIRVNAVCPGYTHSEMVDPVLDAAPDFVAKLLENDVPMGRIAETIEVARAVLWLCSDEASFVTGHALAPDGGWLMK